MNSYPAELLVQLAPVMFVAGLDLPPALSNSPSSALQSLGQTQSPPSAPTKTQDHFTSLITRLRDVIQSQRKPAIWAPERMRAFQMILMGKDVRFPPRKLVPPEDLAYTSAHSPLSPLTPSSPLYPDGLIAPIWIRKHTQLVPSVFVLFLRLFEAPAVHARSPLDPPDPEHERDKTEEERRRDTDLSAEVAARKKTTNERGIKLTTVLLATRRMLDDPSLDSRLTFIRKQSGLDSRAALFVLSPVSTSELNDFARSLQDALYDTALEYYTSHSKRVRRKRNRHSQSVSSYNPPPLVSMGVASTRPLRPEGWTVRYEYKMACFAEFRGEDEVALKHYQDAYATLMIMFGSTAILPPRTKRWAEAKVLADTMNVKITKLYLYNNEHSLALSQHNSHMRRFADFSRGWGIGEETFEYWSWMARQHRVLAELLEQGSNSSLTFPTNSPPSLTAGVTSAGTPVELDAVRAFGLNPTHALQHPGHYYYMAARCTEARRERFLANEGILQGTSAAPGYANEKKVDHLSLILELYTKSYEVFKKHSSTTSQGRLTLWIAYRIAHTYFESEKFDIAVRFFERIAKTYRKEKWKHMLRPLLSTWYACAQKLSEVELMAMLLVEMIGYAQTVNESRTLQEDLLVVLKSPVPVSTGMPLVVDLKESDPLLDTMLVFWVPEVRVGEDAGFQLSLAAPTNIDLSALPIDSVTITFSDGYHPVVLRHSPPTDGQVADKVVRLLKIGKVVPEDEDDEPEEICADLRWRSGERLVVSGSISSEVPGLLTVVSITVVLAQNGWTIEIPHGPCVSHEISALVPRWLTSLQPIQFLQLGRDDCSSVVIRHRPHQLAVSLSHQAPALLDEEYPIVIAITNVDERYLDVVVDVLLQPTEVDKAAQYIIFDDQRSSGLIKGIRLGTIAPGVSATKTLYLVGSGAPGDRMLDISIQSTSVQPNSMGQGDDDAEPRSSRYSSEHATIDSCEKLQTIVIPTSRALTVTYDVAYRRSKNAMPALADLSTVEDDLWDDSYGGVAVVTTRMECVAPCGLVVESLKLHRQDNPLAKVLDCSSDENGNDMYPDEYLPGDELCNVSRISLCPREEQLLGEEIIGPGDYEVVWRRMLPDGGRGRQSTTRFALPTLMIPQDELIALLDVPSFARLHMSTPIHLTVRNRHSSRSANIIVALDLDPSDAFVVAGLRNGRLPILLPSSEEKLSWNLIPIECGHVKIPRIKVMNVRGAALPSQGVGVPSTEVDVEGEPVKVVDVRADRNTARVESAGDGADVVPQQYDASTILVLP
ncbi:Gryzun, putative trafficking through golgi-domain-containing protein [Suillus bovinus]|uniref:Gryzun, putative trafficking through golgi-domain-containing protein n=1 Tax=Suillus bovinus TaxID=48563 RepID=UPI001B86321A|nr:Gryzun, putative trafficking through golgi-domain-containing protein [Suillus bovinus]KAG2132301.1 Gryzun, putative trafficking through golgi-domain-containing protein [Suillus bovinus]